MVNSPLFEALNKIPLPKEGQMNDFKRQPLLSFGISGNGKNMLVEDFDGDGSKDLFVGGGAGLSARLIFGMDKGKMSRIDSSAFLQDRASEDAVAVAFDANGDGSPDIFVGSGGVHQFIDGTPILGDRLYLNDGKGRFKKSAEAFPKEYFSTGAVLAGDFNRDSFLDLLVGGRVIPGQYPTSPGARIWIGDGKGRFSDQTKSLAPGLSKLGMITDIDWAELSGDGTNELVLVGDGMPVTIFSYSNGKWENATSNFFELPQVGLLSDLLIGDWDQDGKSELIVGNHGKNSQLFASDSQPMELVYKDFDSNGSMDAILSYYILGEKYPSPSRDEVLGQVNFLKKKYLDFKSFSEVRMDNLFSPEERKNASSIFINRLETSYFVLNSDGKFISKPLPIQAQFAPVYAAEQGDFNGDGHSDLLLGGNLYQAKLKFGRFGANHVQVFLGNGKGKLTSLSSSESGITLQGEVRGIKSRGKHLFIVLKGKGIHRYSNLSSKE